MLNTTITFAGNLTDDPELRFTTGGTPVVEFRVLINRRIKDGDQWKDGQPTGLNCKLFGKEAENVAESFTRGDRVLVNGDVRTESWEDRESGQKRSREVVYVEEIGASVKWASVQIEKKANENASSAQSVDPWAAGGEGL